MNAIVKVIGTLDGTPSPHDGRWVVGWNPHTPYGTCEIATTPDRALAKVFVDAEEAYRQWHATSVLAPYRPDGLPNRPLTGLTVEIVNLEAAP